MEQYVTVLRLEHLQSTPQGVVCHLLGIRTLGKFFAEKVKAGKPEDFRVADQSLAPPAHVGDKKTREHKDDRQDRKKKIRPRAAKIVPHRSHSRRGSSLNSRLRYLCLTTCFP